MPSRVVVSAPATIANLGPGFDVFGLALAEPADVIEAHATAGAEMKISEVTGVGAGKIPKDPSENTATIAAGKVAEALGREGGAEFTIKKGVKPGGGLGSSGASAAAGAVAMNELLGGKLTDSQLIEAAAFAEAQVAGATHYDNVASSIVGGFVIVASTDPLECIKVEPPKMKIIVAQPELELPTREGRRVLPRKVELEKAVANVGRASAMAAALKEGDLKWFGRYMLDSIAEPARAHLIKGFDEVKGAALGAGALGAAMAGAGPSVFAIIDPKENPKKVEDAMRAAFEEAGTKCETLVTSPGPGAKVVSRED
jgi:homoserine kinase